MIDGLFRDLVNIIAMGRWSPNGRHRRFTRERGTYAAPSRILNDEEENLLEDRVS